MRARTLILPGENAQLFQEDLEEAIEEFDPRTPTEHRMVFDIHSSRWKHERAERAQFERLKTRIEGADDREDEEVDGLLGRLFADVHGSYCQYGVTSIACGGPRTSAPEKVDDSNKPLALVRRLERTAKGCEALLAIWRSIALRVENDLEVLSHDRFRAVRMLGRQPVEALIDQRVALIFVASFGLHPLDKKHAYEDLKSDMGTLELNEFPLRMFKQWGIFVDASDRPRVKQAFLDLIAGVVGRLEAKLETHLEHADERKASIAATLANDDSPQGERLARFELATHRRALRCEDAFWKHRRETCDRTEDEGRRAEDETEDPLEENGADLSVVSGVAEEASGPEEKNLTTEPKAGIGRSEAEALQAVATLEKEIGLALQDLSKLRGMGIGMPAAGVAGGGTGLAALEAAILARGPLMRPIS